MYEYFGSPEKRAGEVKNIREEIRVHLAKKYAGGPRVHTQSVLSVVSDSDMQKAALMIQKSYRVWKAK